MPLSENAPERQESTMNRRDLLKATLGLPFAAAAMQNTLRGDAEAANQAPEVKEKDLRNEWKKAPFKVGDGEGEFEKPKAGLPPQVEIGKKAATITNRGMIVSEKELDAGKGSLHFRYQRGIDTGKGTTYQDQLRIVIRTDGERSRKWPYEIDDGVVFLISSDMVGISGRTSGADSEEILSSTKDIKLPEGEWDITINDKGTSVELLIDGKVIHEAKIDPAFGGKKRKVAVYCREGVANTIHTGVISDYEMK